jgi:hypothetical protein
MITVAKATVNPRFASFYIGKSKVRLVASRSDHATPFELKQDVGVSDLLARIGGREVERRKTAAEGGGGGAKGHADGGAWRA